MDSCSISAANAVLIRWQISCYLYMKDLTVELHISSRHDRNSTNKAALPPVIAAPILRDAARITSSAVIPHDRLVYVTRIGRRQRYGVAEPSTLGVDFDYTTPDLAHAVFDCKFGRASHKDRAFPSIMPSGRSGA